MFHTESTDGDLDRSAVDITNQGTPTPMNCRHRTSEHAFTLVELIVVMLIAATITAVAVTTLSNLRNETTRKRGFNAAKAYGEAIRAFQLDHDGRPPIPGSAEWPSSGADRGPVDTMRTSGGQGSPYMRGGVPETVQDGHWGVSLAGQGGRGGSSGTMTYTVSTATAEWELLVASSKGELKQCILGTTARAKSPTTSLPIC